MKATGAETSGVEAGKVAHLLAQRSAAADVKGPGGDRSSACRILLIEDDEPVRERLAGILIGWSGGQLTAACGNLADATTFIRHSPIDLLITDLNLPDGNGVQAIR